MLRAARMDVFLLAFPSQLRRRSVSVRHHNAETNPSSAQEKKPRPTPQLSNPPNPNPLGVLFVAAFCLCSRLRPFVYDSTVQEIKKLEQEQTVKFVFNLGPAQFSTFFVFVLHADAVFGTTLFRAKLFSPPFSG